MVKRLSKNIRVSEGVRSAAVRSMKNNIEGAGYRLGVMAGVGIDVLWIDLENFENLDLGEVRE